MSPWFLSRRVMHGIAAMLLAASGAQAAPAAPAAPTAPATPAAPATTAPVTAASSAAPLASSIAPLPQVTASAQPALGTAAPAAALADTPTCHEHVPEGKQRPEFTEAFPTRGQSGHSALLTVTLTHGLGEKLLPGAFEFQADSDSAKAVRSAGFVMPDPAGTAKVRVQRTEKNGLVESKVSIPLVPLPKKPGRNELTLPPLPIAMTRSSGEVITLCTQPHAITVEDPIANQPDAKPKASLKPRRQRELWQALRNAVYGGGIGLVVAALVTALVLWWRKRPKVLPPPPPPRPAWEIALESLHDIRQSHLVEQGRLDVHLERVSHVLRKYLGGRYGFEALESTSEEILSELKRLDLPRDVFVDVRQFLAETDLVKFADVAPTESQCTWALDQAETLVTRTRPEAQSAAVTLPTAQEVAGSIPPPSARRGLEDPTRGEPGTGDKS